MKNENNVKLARLAILVMLIGGVAIGIIRYKMTQAIHAIPGDTKSYAVALVYRTGFDDVLQLQRYAAHSEDEANGMALADAKAAHADAQPKNWIAIELK